MRANEFLSELFKPGKNWEWSFRGSEEAVAKFQIGDVPYQFIAYTDIGNPGVWEAEFKQLVRGGDRRTRFGLTGTGNSAEVMSTVVDILRNFLQEYHGNVNTLVFSAKESSRQSLYRKMLERLLPNWEITTDVIHGETQFIAKRPQEVTENAEPKVLYHVTPSRNVKSILQKGLVPSIGARSRQLETDSNLYFFPSKDAAEDAVMNWLGDEFPEDEPLSLLAVSSNGLEGKFTKGAEYEYTVSSAVPPQNIKVLSTNI